jgi:hypothetical protein
MKSKLRVILLALCIAFSIFLSSCSYTNPSIGNWGPWSDWRQEGSTESRNVVVTSQPDGANVYVNGNLTTKTPASLVLSYPILKSERARTHYESFTPGIIEYLLLFSRPKTTPVSYEKDLRLRKGSQTYSVEVRREGYLPTKRAISVPDISSLNCILRKKPMLYMKPFAVTNNVTISMAERLYDLIYGGRLATDISRLKDIDKRYLSPQILGEAFEITGDKNADYIFEGEIIIGKKTTEIRMVITDHAGRPIATRRTSMETKSIGDIYLRIESQIRDLKDSFLEQY